MLEAWPKIQRSRGSSSGMQVGTDARSKSEMTEGEQRSSGLKQQQDLRTWVEIGSNVVQLCGSWLYSDCNATKRHSRLKALLFPSGAFRCD